MIDVQLHGPKRTLQRSSVASIVRPRTQASSDITILLLEYSIDLNFNRGGQLISITRSVYHDSTLPSADWPDIEVAPERRIELSSCPDPASLMLEFAHQIIFKAIGYSEVRCLI